MTFYQSLLETYEVDLPFLAENRNFFFNFALETMRLIKPFVSHQTIDVLAKKYNFFL